MNATVWAYPVLKISIAKLGESTDPSFLLVKGTGFNGLLFNGLNSFTSFILSILYLLV